MQATFQTTMYYDNVKKSRAKGTFSANLFSLAHSGSEKTEW